MKDPFPLPKLSAAAALVLLLLSGRGSPSAAPLTCHCFRNRTFNPAAPAEADPYILATTQNTFFAVAFGIPKRAVVRAKMKGIAGDDLWTAYYAASTLGLPPAGLMASKEEAGSWKEALARSRVRLAPLGERFVGLLEEGAPDTALAVAAACEVLVRTLGFSRREMDVLAARGRSTGRIIASSLLSRWSGRPALSLVEEIDAGETSWGGLMDGLGIRPDMLEERIGALAGGGRQP